MDIGQGDAAIVVCDGKTLVIDGGMPESGAKLVDYLQNTLHVSTIDAMIGTHPHAGSHRQRPSGRHHAPLR
ncbi:MAG: MBL fold metallo-hydrolase [Christensenellales bacterium]